MNHDYEHCIDFNDGCPESCFQAQLVRDLEQNYPPSMEVSWMSFGDSPDCERNRRKEMTKEEFATYYGMTPERAKQILEELRHIVNQEVHEVIAHADYYIDPVPYGYTGELQKEDEDDDGYTCLYDFGNLTGGSVKAFMRLISFHTRHGGHTSAIEACRLMGIEWEADR